MPTIDKLSQSDVLQSDDVLAVFQQANDDTRKVAVGVLAARLNEIIQGDPDETIYSLAMDGDSFTASALPTAPGGSVWLQLTLSGTAASGTINLPDIDNRANGQEVLVTVTQEVTSLTVNGLGASVAGAPSSLGANGFFRMRYDSISNCWFRVG